ncbi:hypothetical protein [Microbulbifer sp. GL-2]|uniref:hypothetical protein n=1 Tax=Microbulbifer sp. GL-2 TaxID=2591606 RepID=UPI001162F708|nr:hypothetical protein [Microbulbifer sp. GL-2]BBM03057.1 hypothetical protein GL2_31310 [Microbulbifer sp. GL-2]
MLELLVALAMSIAGCGYQGQTTAMGLAFDPQSQSLKYCEYFLPSEGGRMQVLYYSPVGQLIAKKTLLDHTGEPRAGTTMPELVQIDLRHGEVREVLREQGKWLMRYRKSAQENWKSARRDTASIDVVDAGFEVYVRKHWKALIRGDTLKFNFASPLHGNAIKLRAHKVTCTEKLHNQLCFRVDVAQPLLRLFAGDLELAYDKSSRRLLWFEGVVNILDPEAKSQRLKIFYQYY